MRFFGQEPVGPSQFPPVHFREIFRGNLEASAGVVVGRGWAPVGFGFLVKLTLPYKIFHILILVPETPRNKVVVEIEYATSGQE